MKRNRKKWLALIRHILTFLGGALVVNDIDSGLVNEAIGGVLTTVGPGGPRYLCGINEAATVAVAVRRNA
jgi:hypothetical protein